VFLFVAHEFVKQIRYLELSFLNHKICIKILLKNSSPKKITFRLIVQNKYHKKYKFEKYYQRTENISEETLMLYCKYYVLLADGSVTAFHIQSIAEDTVEQNF
jgi:hypothetical protein